jgi:hypothetical protein
MPHRATRYFALGAIAVAVVWPIQSPASDVTLEQVWAVVQQQQAQIDELNDELNATRTALVTAETTLASTRQQVQLTEEQLGVTADYVSEVVAASSKRSASATTIGGYGELHVSDVNSEDSSGDFTEADFHRFVLFFGHEFSDRMRLVSEFELEHALVKDTDDGSNGGEVELEQAYIEFDLNENHWSRAGVFLIPVGMLNETHEPPTFYGVERNDVENIIIPSTWWEAGVSAGGRYENGLSWDAAIHTGLEMPTAGGSAFRIRSGRQKVANANADNLAYSLRLRYTAIPGLELGGSFHHQSDPSQFANDGLDSGNLVSLHGIWQQGPFSLRALWARWDFDGSAVTLIDADEQTGWYVEPSLRLSLGGHDWGFYTRYEDLRGARTRDQFAQWEVGFNYWPTPRVVLKFDYRDRDHDLASEAGRDFHAIDLGIGYQF